MSDTSSLKPISLNLAPQQEETARQQLEKFAYPTLPGNLSGRSATKSQNSNDIGNTLTNVFGRKKDSAALTDIEQEYALICCLSKGALQKAFTEKDLDLIHQAAKRVGLIQGDKKSEDKHSDLSSIVQCLTKQILHKATTAPETFRAYAARFYRNHREHLKAFGPPSWNIQQNIAAVGSVVQAASAPVEEQKFVQPTVQDWIDNWRRQALDWQTNKQLPRNFCYKLLCGKVFSHDGSVNLDKWLYRILFFAEGFPTAQRDKIQETLQHLEQKLGHSNAIALLVRAYQLSEHIKATGTVKQKLNASQASELYKNELEQLLMKNPQGFSSFTQSMPLFDKTAVSPVFIKALDDATKNAQIKYTVLTLAKSLLGSASTVAAALAYMGLKPITVTPEITPTQQSDKDLSPKTQQDVQVIDSQQVKVVETSDTVSKTVSDTVSKTASEITKAVSDSVPQTQTVSDVTKTISDTVSTTVSDSNTVSNPASGTSLSEYIFPNSDINPISSSKSIPILTGNQGGTNTFTQTAKPSPQNTQINLTDIWSYMPEWPSKPDWMRIPDISSLTNLFPEKPSEMPADLLEKVKNKLPKDSSELNTFFQENQTAIISGAAATVLIALAVAYTIKRRRNHVTPPDLETGKGNTGNNGGKIPEQPKAPPTGNNLTPPTGNSGGPQNPPEPKILSTGNNGTTPDGQQNSSGGPQNPPEQPKGAPIGTTTGGSQNLPEQPKGTTTNNLTPHTGTILGGPQNPPVQPKFPPVGTTLGGPQTTPDQSKVPPIGTILGGPQNTPGQSGVEAETEKEDGIKLEDPKKSKKKKKKKKKEPGVSTPKKANDQASDEKKDVVVGSTSGQDQDSPPPPPPPPPTAPMPPPTTTNTPPSGLNPKSVTNLFAQINKGGFALKNMEERKKEEEEKRKTAPKGGNKSAPGGINMSDIQNQRKKIQNKNNTPNNTPGNKPLVEAEEPEFIKKQREQQAKRESQGGQGITPPNKRESQPDIPIKLVTPPGKVTTPPTKKEDPKAEWQREVEKKRESQQQLITPQNSTLSEPGRLPDGNLNSKEGLENLSGSKTLTGSKRGSSTGGGGAFTRQAMPMDLFTDPKLAQTDASGVKKDDLKDLLINSATSFKHRQKQHEVNEDNSDTEETEETEGMEPEVIEHKKPITKNDLATFNADTIVLKDKELVAYQKELVRNLSGYFDLLNKDSNQSIQIKFLEMLQFVFVDLKTEVVEVKPSKVKIASTKLKEHSQNAQQRTQELTDFIAQLKKLKGTPEVSQNNALVLQDEVKKSESISKTDRTKASIAQQAIQTLNYARKAYSKILQSLDIIHHELHTFDGKTKDFDNLWSNASESYDHIKNFLTNFFQMEKELSEAADDLISDVTLADPQGVFGYMTMKKSGKISQQDDDNQESWQT